MGLLSRTKGKVGEREVVKLCVKHFGAKAEGPGRCRRAQQSDGELAADVLNGIPGFHIEVKFYKSIPWLEREAIGVGTLFRDSRGETWLCDKLTCLASAGPWHNPPWARSVPAQILQWVEKSWSDSTVAPGPTTPVIFMRENGGDWRVALPRARVADFCSKMVK